MTSNWKPNLVNQVLTQLLLQRDLKKIPLRVSSVAFSLLNEKGWRFFVVDQTRGRCYWKHGREQVKVITIPKWICSEENRKNGYFIQYLSHEMAHAVCFEDGLLQEQHGPNFMEALKKICPPEYWHFETSYKERNAARAGISSIQVFNKINSGKFDIDDIL